MSPLLRLEGRRERALFIARQRSCDAKVKHAIRCVLHDHKRLKPTVVGHKFFGAAHVAPEHLTICLFYKRDCALFEACEKGYFELLRGALIVALRRECYPTKFVIDAEIVFLSQQAVKNVGGFWSYWH